VNCVVVIPCLNEATRIGSVVRSVQLILQNVIVVDDGSSDGTNQEATEAGAEILRHATNQGKGTAIQSGLARAVERGFEWALLMDGDGQHAASDIPKFLNETGARLVIGNRMANPEGMPWLRRMVNRWMSVRLSRRSGVDLPDTQCGFRLVHLPSWSNLNLETRHFEVESEMLVAFVEGGYSVKFVPIKVIYKKHASKISPVVDTFRWFRWWWRRNEAGRSVPAEPQDVHAR
jgi:glycosyltransferase involved in cell wall biosynthesis